jgi:hypothetical protein
MTYKVTHIQFDWLDCEDDYDGSAMRANIEKAKSLTYEANSREELVQQIYEKVVRWYITELEYENV